MSKEVRSGASKTTKGSIEGASNNPPISRATTNRSRGSKTASGFVQDSRQKDVAPDWLEIEKVVEAQDKHWADVQVEEAQAYEAFDLDVKRLTHAIRIESATIKHVDEKTTARLREADEKSTTALRAVRNERHVVETKLERIADVKVQDGRSFLAEEMEAHKIAVQYTQGIGDEMCKLYTDIEQARRYRIEKGEKLADAVRVKIGEVRDAVAAEHRIRLESESTLLDLFSELGQKMQKELDECRKQRHSATDKLIQVAEKIVPELEMSRVQKGTVGSEQLQGQVDVRSMAKTVGEAYARRKTVMTQNAGF
eukprot:gnl/TRDRNA2_/TRDRNA2_68717_c1_seq1.p1 gnl/TRDRNA2_/TRDRNA2_68717_c1~~gnl/TRDRNA2_/TRDRNA2_68717_c1_seq1.p1  ORF type:complete len:323 (+),score=78.71 gnl/TRDRNA2_/TRDRNA2_68717_c1_seq1:40-969(+)